MVGNELPLTMNGEKCVIYSIIDLQTMRDLIRHGGVVMAVSRNMRRDRYVDKTEAIRAALRSGCINVMFTDESTAEQVIKQPFRLPPAEKAEEGSSP